MHSPFVGWYLQVEAADGDGFARRVSELPCLSLRQHGGADEASSRAASWVLCEQATGWLSAPGWD